MVKFPNIAARAFNTPLLLETGKAKIISEYIQKRLYGDWNPEPQDNQDQQEEDQTVLFENIAIIPVIGTLVHRGGWMDADSGLLSYQKLKGQLIDAANDMQVRMIFLDIDSGGGEVEGNFELAKLIREINDNHKPVVALANGSAFSGAYSLGCAAGEFFVTETGGVGSVGVIMQHVDLSKMNEMQGIKVTNITSGSHKADFSSDHPLSDSAKAVLQKEVDRTADMFISLVADLRGISADVVRGTEAALLFGQDAVKIGFVDGVTSFDDLLSTLVTSSISNPLNSKQRIQDMLLKKKTETEEPKAADPAPVEPVKVEPPADPAPIKEEPKAIDPVEAAAEIADICQKAGMSHMTSGFIRAKMSKEEVQAKVDLNKQIEQVCKLAGKPELAKGYIEAGKPLKDVQDDLISKMSKVQEATDISGTQTTADVTKSVDTAKNVIMEDIERRNKAKGV